MTRIVYLVAAAAFAKQKTVGEIGAGKFILYVIAIIEIAVPLAKASTAI